MSKKHQQKQQARVRAKREAARAARRTRTRLFTAVAGGVLLVAAIVGVWWFVGRDAATTDDPDPLAGASEAPSQAQSELATEAAPETGSETGSEAGSEAAGATDLAFEPCPVPGDDAPAVDTSLQYDAPPPADRTGTLVATIETTCGTIVAELDADAAPQTVSSFAFLAEEDFYVGTPFHRIGADFVIQGGDPTGTGTGGPGYTFDDELGLAEEVVTANDGNYPRGTLAMANSGPNSNSSQFYVVQPDPGYPFPPDYAVFGMVTEGMDVVDRIANGPVTGARNDQAVDPTLITDVTIAEG